MGDILRVPNNNGLFLMPRTASHSIVKAAFKTFWPTVIIGEESHPACRLPIQENWNGTNEKVGLLIRNPVERFRSMVAHRSERSLLDHLSRPAYGPLQMGNFIKYFRFEDQLQECADWLGITVSLEQIDSTEPASKPNLTPEQEAIVREIYKNDILLWESLNA